ncbi:MAG: flagellar hook-length control protein FliK [Methylophilus sp.]|nr:flagellar hook-length control protein FliK [Methylophilus sp.]
MYIAKPESTNTQQVGSVQRVLPVLPVGAINSPSHELEAQAKFFTQGETYSARVTQRVSERAFLVEVKADASQQFVLKMELGQQARVGQSLSLQYLREQPVMTFMLKQPANIYTGTTVNLSQTGSLLGQYLGQAEAQHASTRFEAIQTVTHFPFKPHVMAHDLQQALSRSGLFYESHLQGFSHGQYSLQQIKQEPQNQPGFNPANLMFQQLAVLEHQRFSWHGEVWSGQEMTWDVYEQRLPTDAEQSQQLSDEERLIASELNIDFPNLGAVKVKMSMMNGHLRIHLESETAQTYQLLQQQKAKLAESMHKNGQVLDGLTVGREQI